MKDTTRLVYNFWLIVGVLGLLAVSIYDRGELTGSPGWLLIGGCCLLFAVAAFGLGMRRVWGWRMLTALLSLLSLLVISRMIIIGSDIVAPSEPFFVMLMIIIVDVTPPVLGLLILLSDRPDRWRKAQ